MKSFFEIWRTNIKEFVFRKPKEVLDIDRAILAILNDAVLKNREEIITQEELINKIERAKKDRIKELIIKSIGNKSDVLIKNNMSEIASIICTEYNRIVKSTINDIGGIRSKIINQSNKVDYSLKFKFYYDETNNYRKFYINDKGNFNQPIENFFVLGGLCLDEKQKDNVESLMSNLKLQKNVKELKAHHVFKSQDFLECLNASKLNVLLRWINNNRILIHFVAVDHMFIFASDIADMICADEKEKVFYADIIYGFIEKDTNSVFDIMSRFKYPQIQNSELNAFLQAWKDYILQCKKNNDIKDNFDKLAEKVFYDLVIERIDTVLISDVRFENRDFIVEKYDIYYQIMPILFLNSNHIFDEELEVQAELLKNAQWTINEQKITNYFFTNSVNSKMVQVSDVMVSLISKLLKYTREFETGNSINISLSKLKSSLKTQRQRENFCLLMKIIKNSYEKNQQFICVHGCYTKRNILDLLLSISKITEESIFMENYETD